MCAGIVIVVPPLLCGQWTLPDWPDCYRKNNNRVLKTVRRHFEAGAEAGPAWRGGGGLQVQGGQ